jgi:hypothetical protein
MIVVVGICALTLNDHVAQENASIHHLSHLVLRPSESGIPDILTITNRDCSTPNAPSTSFLQLSRCLA